MKKYILLLLISLSSILVKAQSLSCDIQINAVSYSTYDLCIGEDIVLNGTPAGGTLPYTSMWSGGGTQLSPANSNPTAFTATTPGTYTITYTVTDGISAICSDQIVINVVPKPTAYMVTGGGAYCSGGTGTAVGLSGSDPGVNYQLLCNGTPVSGGFIAGTGSAISFGNQTDSCCYTVIATNASAFCSRTMLGNACIIIDSLPTVVITANPSIVCPGECSTISASGGVIYSWATGETNSSIVVCPATTTTYCVTVTGANGCTSSGCVTVTVDNIFVMASSDPDSVCNGQSSNLDIIIGGGTAPYTYYWSPATGLSCFGCLQPVASPGSTTNYCVTVTDTYGCYASDCITVFVDPALNVDAGNPQTICFGNCVNLGGTPTVSGGTPPYSYIWSPCACLSCCNCANPAACPTTTTTFFVTISDAAGCFATNCVTITVDPALLADAGEDDTICFGDCVTIGGSTTASGGTSPYIYSWSSIPPDPSMICMNCANSIVCPLVTTTYCVTVTDAIGGTASDCVTISVDPEIIITLSSTGLSFCGGCDGTITANVIGGTPPYYYIWSTSPMQDTPTATNLCAGNYCVTVTDAIGCTATSCATLNDLPAPVVNLVSSDADNTICDGDCISFTASGGVITYDFFVNGSIVQSGVSNVFTTCSLNDGDMVVVQGTDATGCLGSSNIITVNINSLPTAFNVTGGGAYCAGGPGLPIGLSGSETGVTYYLFCNSMGILQVPGTGGPISFGNWTYSCCYYVIAENSSTFCQNTMNGNACVTINENPIVTVTASPDTICSPGCSNLIALADSGCAPYTFQWGPPSGGTTQAIIVCPALNTTYCLTLTDCNGCTAFGCDTVIVDICTGLIENGLQHVQLSPNPFSISAEITSDKYFNDAELKVYDVLGNLVKEIKNISGSTICLNRSGMRDGMYFYKILEKKTSIFSGKFILN
jgi:hypothetical protein